MKYITATMFESEAPSPRCAGSGETMLYDGETTMGLRFICPVCRRCWVKASLWGHNGLLQNPVTPEHSV